jgi:hypothetical protein
MQSPDVKTPSIKHRTSARHSEDNNSPYIRHGEASDQTILTTLQQYVPNTPEEKRLVRKIDFVLLPVLWWMYVLAHLDRSNIANANAAGMSEDLGLSDNRT